MGFPASQTGLLCLKIRRFTVNKDCFNEAEILLLREVVSFTCANSVEFSKLIGRDMHKELLELYIKVSREKLL
jgi:hypothetical protein